MVKVFLDSGDPLAIGNFIDMVGGLTTNPSLLRSGGIKDYRSFAMEVLALACGKPVSFEVFADDLPTIERQALQIAQWAENIYVKIPCMLTNGDSTGVVVQRLSQAGIKLNITALMTLPDIRAMARFLSPDTPAILSVFAGRIADTGRNPVPYITAASQVKHAKTEVLWASTREVYNITEAAQCGCDVITVAPDILKKRALNGKDLAQYSRETVQQFFNDAKGITL